MRAPTGAVQRPPTLSSSPSQTALAVIAIDRMCASLLRPGDGAFDLQRFRTLNADDVLVEVGRTGMPSAWILPAWKHSSFLLPLLQEILQGSPDLRAQLDTAAS